MEENIFLSSPKLNQEALRKQIAQNQLQIKQCDGNPQNVGVKEIN